MPLGRYFQALGTSFDKYIPREFFEYPDLLEEVLKGIYLGDACYRQGDAWDVGTLRTRSKRLADDVQEAWTRLGRVSTVYVRQLAGKPLYEIRPCKTSHLMFWRHERETKKRIQLEFVDSEDVFCFTVPHHRPIVKGDFASKAIISGNSYDEFQEMLYDAVVPVVNACMKNSDYRYELYAGTPKTMENSIQFLWEKSTQSEWVMKCEGCGSYNYVVSEKALGLAGPICLKCGKGLNPRNGFWQDMVAPAMNKKTGKKDQIIKGFHISQAVMPENIALCYPNNAQKAENAQMRWDDLLRDMELHSPAKFRNEVLGVSDAQGRRLISLEELQALCTGPELSDNPQGAGGNREGVSFTVAGIDWSGGGTGGLSRTVLWIWGWMPKQSKMRCMYYKIFPGNNAVTDVKEILTMLQRYNVAMVVGDAGEGALANSTLREQYGMHRVQQVMYGSFATPITYKVDKFLCDRTTLIDNYIMLLKRRGVEYAPYDEMKSAISDVLNEYEEVTSAGKKVWRHSPQLPDDCLHAQIFGWWAWKIVTSDFKLYV